jgi:hypothetical protein
MSCSSTTTVCLLNDAFGCVRNFGHSSASRASSNTVLPCSAAYWHALKPVLVEAPNKPPSNKVAKLQCLRCNEVLVAANPANIGADHFDKHGNCKKSLAKSKKHSSCDIGSSVASSKCHIVDMTSLDGKKDAAQLSMHSFTVPPAQAAAAMEELIKGLICTATPSAVSNPHIKKAFSILGVELPGQPLQQ